MYSTIYIISYAYCLNCLDRFTQCTVQYSTAPLSSVTISILRYFLFVFHGFCKPVHSFIKSISRSSTAALNIPLAATKSMQTQLVRHFSGTHGVGKILFIGVNQQHSISQNIFRHHFVYFIASLINVEHYNNNYESAKLV